MPKTPFPRVIEPRPEERADARSPQPHSSTTRLAGSRIRPLPPLRHQHLQRQGMERRHPGPRHLRPERVRRRPMGRHRTRGGRRVCDPHRQAPRRILSVAHRDHRLLGEVLTLAPRQGRRGRRTGRGVQEGGPETRPLPVPLGPQRALLRRPGRLRRLLPAPADRTVHTLRPAVRAVVRRRRIRRAHIRLGRHHGGHRRASAGRDGLQHGPSDDPLGGQRGRPGLRPLRVRGGGHRHLRLRRRKRAVGPGPLPAARVRRAPPRQLVLAAGRPAHPQEPRPPARPLVPLRRPRQPACCSTCLRTAAA